LGEEKKDRDLDQDRRLAGEEKLSSASFDSMDQLGQQLAGIRT